MTSIFKYIALVSLPLAIGIAPQTPAYAQSDNAGNSQSLQDALRRIARNSNDSSALADAGLAALELGDTRAAIGFLAKADQIYPRSGRVKAGLAQALLQEENPFGAIRYFDQAVQNGIPVRSIAADRGLAYDLIGRNADAQKDYELALQYGDNDDLRNRYAISLGISGDMEKAEAVLNPLLQKSDRDAWRNRAFLLAMNGRQKDANVIARQTMQRKMANAIKPFFDRMPKLTPAQKAAAVHFGHFPASENIGVDVASVRYASNSAVRGGDGADAGLIPLGEPLGVEAKKPRVLAMPDTSARRRPGARRGEEVRRVSKREMRRMERQGIKFTVLSEAELPAPANVRPAVKPKIEPPTIRNVEPIKSADVKGPPPNQPKITQVATVTPESAQPVGVTNSNSATQTSNNVPQSPGFETALGVSGQASRPAASNKPVELAVASVPVPKTPAVSPPVKAPTPLISETITRKVDIGGIGSSPEIKPSPKPSIGAKPEARPTELASFNLNSIRPESNTNVSAPVRVAQIGTESEKRPLADIINSISIPDSEKKTEVVPVDLGTITPAKKEPAAKPELKEEPKKAEPKTEEHPKRNWVQIATGSNLSALKYDFRQMKKKNAELFGKMEGWTSPWGNTRRMVIGPFDELSDAKKFDAEFRKQGGDSFAWVSSTGTEVNKLTK